MNFLFLASLSCADTLLPLYPFAYTPMHRRCVAKGEGVRKSKIRRTYPFAFTPYPFRVRICTPLPLCTEGARGDCLWRKGYVRRLSPLVKAMHLYPVGVRARGTKIEDKITPFAYAKGNGLPEVIHPFASGDAPVPLLPFRLR